ncbi:MAG TPA: CDP-glycerol:glycerophosphate glycerophosphotransferase, partial [Lachnospiraceae bacterium]|uniref:CDP-glycerol glycerophosphotransferase family protein n=1 Tax=Anaerosporobacter sp. TaxID=1872529 RepID=UPI000EEEB503
TASLSGYKNKLVKRLIKGDLSATKRVVNIHLGSKKVRKIKSNPRAFACYLYFHLFTKMKMKDNWVLFESFFGKSYSDSPKYIYEYLNQAYPNEYKCIWVINDKKTKIPYGAIKVKRFSIRYAYYFARCKYDVLNVRQPNWIRKRKGNVFLETWHGTPLKRLVFDQEEVCGASPLHKQQFYRQSRDWDYLISDNGFSTETFKRAFLFHNEIVECGYPRNDVLYAPDKEARIIKLKNQLGIPRDKKTILYAPTWRDDEYYGKGEYKFALKLDLHELKRQLGDEYVLLLRTHYYIADSIDTTGIEDFAFNVSKYNDISELYLISDLLITDYSSVFFDYANLRRPILFYTYDLEKYRDMLRGFYLDIEKDMPGPLLFTEEEVIAAIKDIANIEKRYQDKYDEFYERFCHVDDGNASKRIVERVFRNKQGV